MAEIVLTTLNARFAHCAFGLRYLLANLGELRPRAALIEFDINQRTIEIAEALLAHNPRIIGLGVYIWNATPACELVALLKRLSPETLIILGGPEVSHETDAQEIVRLADHVITGEADLVFAGLCRQILTGQRPPQKVLPADLPDLARIALPYDDYSDADLAHRVLYVEASRGCPFSCEFCLSSVDGPVRAFPIQPFLTALEGLWRRGARQFKFVDRTFNLHPGTAQAILKFFLARIEPGLFLHFEMVPDRFPEALRELVKRFPLGTLQFEVGVQTFNPEVARRISRRQEYEKLSANLRWLREETGVHVHADLIAGLPGETLESFAAGFDQLVALRPHEIQVGILKRLRGTPIIRHDVDWGMVYSPHPPCEILRNRLLDFPTLQRLRRFARFWDLTANSGRFRETLPLIWNAGSPFQGFLHWSDWLHARIGRQHGIALDRLAEKLFEFLTTETAMDVGKVAAVLWRDYQQTGQKDPPPFLREHLTDGGTRQRMVSGKRSLKRQARHLASPREIPD